MAFEPEPGARICRGVRVTAILSIALLVTLSTSLILVTRWRDTICRGPTPVSLVTFIAILFTSGLDVGLIMFPMVDFSVYAREEPYGFSNPLAIEFGFWGFLVWGFYFLTTFYFCVVEPRLKLFEIPAVHVTNNLVIITTCAFTGYLLLRYLPEYVAGIGDVARYGIVALVVLCAAVSSARIRFLKALSVSSTWLFLALVAAMWASSGMWLEGFGRSIVALADYFPNVHRFVTPITDYHQFYLYWWFAWSIMIGQFVARFASGLKAWQLLLALLIIPSIPIAAWFSVLYYFFANGIEIGSGWRLAMVVVGVIFVINSLDSLIRLYTQNIGFTTEKAGYPVYVAANWLMLMTLILLFRFTPLEIEWIGLVVVGIYAAVYVLVLQRRNDLAENVPAAARIAGNRP